MLKINVCCCPCCRFECGLEFHSCLLILKDGEFNPDVSEVHTDGQTNTGDLEFSRDSVSLKFSKFPLSFHISFFPSVLYRLILQLILFPLLLYLLLVLLQFLPYLLHLPSSFLISVPLSLL